MFEQKEIKYEMKLLSSLAKVFQDETPVYQPECLKLSALWGDGVFPGGIYRGLLHARASGCQGSIADRKPGPG